MKAMNHEIGSESRRTRKAYVGLTVRLAKSMCQIGILESQIGNRKSQIGYHWESVTSAHVRIRLADRTSLIDSIDVGGIHFGWIESNCLICIDVQFVVLVASIKQSSSWTEWNCSESVRTCWLDSLNSLSFQTLIRFVNRSNWLMLRQWTDFSQHRFKCCFT